MKMEIDFFMAIVIFHLLIYILAANRAVHTYRKIALHTRSDLNDGKINLIRRTMLVLSVVFVIAVIQFYVGDSHSEIIHDMLLVIISIILLVTLLIIIYQAMDNPSTFAVISDGEKAIARQAEIPYDSPGLSDHQVMIYTSQIKEFMESEKPYQNYDLSINKLAADLEIPVRDLSQIINREFGQNFFEFINTYRIRDAKILLQSPELRISEVMYQVGFSSRSSFNSAFRKHTKMTPTQYRRHLR
jgi:AraC-like DNA-binding protein